MSISDKIYGDEIDSLAAKENILVCKDLQHKVKSIPGKHLEQRF